MKRAVSKFFSLKNKICLGDFHMTVEKQIIII